MRYPLARRIGRRLTPTRVAVGYVAVLVAIVAALLPHPFNPILLAVFWGWLGLFFAVAAIVVGLTYAWIVSGVVRRIVRGLVVVAASCRGGPRKSGRVPPPLWDPWIDEIDGP